MEFAFKVTGLSHLVDWADYSAIVQIRTYRNGKGNDFNVVYWPKLTLDPVVFGKKY